MNLYAHLDPDTLHATVDNVGAPDVLIDQIKAWCQTVGNTVIIRPVIDLNTQISTNAYTPTEKLVEQVRLRDQVCVFPHCPRRAQMVRPRPPDPLQQEPTPPPAARPRPRTWRCCAARHHRAKTFSPWTYQSPEPGVYDWTSPSGLRYRVTRGRRHGRLPITTPLEEP